MLGAIVAGLRDAANAATGLLVAAHTAVTPAPIPQQDSLNATPTVIVADAERPLDRALTYAQSLVSGGGHVLTNLHLLVIGDETRRMGAYQPLAASLMEYQRHGGSLYVCAEGASLQRVDMMGMVPGVRILPDDSLPSDLHERLMKNCDLPAYAPPVPATRGSFNEPDMVLPTEESLWPKF